MTAILKPIAFLLIIVAAYLVKRAGLFRPRDYRVMQVVVFDFTLPASIIVSFATNPHHLSMLLISVFAIVFGLLPLLLVYAATTAQARRGPRVPDAQLLRIQHRQFLLPRNPGVHGAFGAGHRLDVRHRQFRDRDRRLKRDDDVAAAHRHGPASSPNSMREPRRHFPIRNHGTRTPAGSPAARRPSRSSRDSLLRCRSTCIC